MMFLAIPGGVEGMPPGKILCSEKCYSESNCQLENGVIKYCNVIGQCLDSKSHRILSGYLQSSLLT